MKISHRKLALSIAIALSIPSLAQAEGYYVTGQIGYSFQASDVEPTGNNLAVDPTFPDDFDAGDGAVFAIGLGYIFNENYRLEGRISYREGNFDEGRLGAGERADQVFVADGDIESITYTIDAFYDFSNNSIFTPYIKAGIGLADNSYSTRLGGSGVAGFFDSLDGTADGFYTGYSDGDSTEFSWSVGFGGNFEVSENTSIYLEYQYANFGDTESGQDSLNFGSTPATATNDGFGIDNAAAHEIIMGVGYAF